MRPFPIRLLPLLMVLSSVAPLVGSDWPDPAQVPIAPGPFRPELESLRSYRAPTWFRDAKFGIWSHWGPQAVPRRGDWYARRIYEQLGMADPNTGKIRWGNDGYVDHVNRWGHPSERGYKDLLPLWKAERWDPRQLMQFFKRAGARYFVSMAVHHDNFALWNSPSHRWNSVQIGPKRDIVAEWQAAARAEGLPFGVSEHLAASYTWFQTAHGADAAGPKAGVPYDGNDPRYADLYHPKAAADDTGWLTKDVRFHAQWHARIRELIDAYQPDLLYSDSVLPFGDVGVRLVAHFYNQGSTAAGPQAVYTCKQPAEGRWVQDLERGVMDSIQAEPWQTDTSIGDWFYRKGQRYRTSTSVIHQLVDIVSKNGNLLLNVVQTPEGDLEPEVVAILEEVGAWMQINGEAIYGTRPWRVFGERPLDAKEVKSHHFNEDLLSYSAQDIRFTTSADGATLYATVMGWPKEGKVVLRSLATGSPYVTGDLGAVRLLGGSGALPTARTAAGLEVSLPSVRPSASASVLAISLPAAGQR